MARALSNSIKDLAYDIEDAKNELKDFFDDIEDQELDINLSLVDNELRELEELETDLDRLISKAEGTEAINLLNKKKDLLNQLIEKKREYL